MYKLNRKPYSLANELKISIDTINGIGVVNVTLWLSYTMYTCDEMKVENSIEHSSTLNFPSISNIHGSFDSCYCVHLIDKDLMLLILCGRYDETTTRLNFI